MVFPQDGEEKATAALFCLLSNICLNIHSAFSIGIPAPPLSFASERTSTAIALGELVKSQVHRSNFGGEQRRRLARSALVARTDSRWWR